jgi:hypothetical protein
MPPSSSVENGEGSVSAVGLFLEDQSAWHVRRVRLEQDRYNQDMFTMYPMLTILPQSVLSECISHISHSAYFIHCVCFLPGFLLRHASFRGDLYVPAVQGVPDRPTVAHPPHLPTKRGRLTLRRPGVTTGPGQERRAPDAELALRGRILFGP